MENPQARVVDGSNGLLLEVDGQIVPNYDATFRAIEEGEVVTGHVVRIDKDEVLVDIGYKSEGVIPANEFIDIGVLQIWSTIEVLVDVAAAHGASPAQVALAWLLTRPAVTSLIIGARTDEQLLDNLGAASLALTADEIEALDKVSAPDLIYPHWHQLATSADRLGPADLSLLGRHLRSS